MKNTVTICLVPEHPMTLGEHIVDFYILKGQFRFELGRWFMFDVTIRWGHLDSRVGSVFEWAGLTPHVVMSPSIEVSRRYLDHHRANIPPSNPSGARLLTMCSLVYLKLLFNIWGRLNCFSCLIILIVTTNGSGQFPSETSRGFV